MFIVAYKCESIKLSKPPNAVVTDNIAVRIKISK